MYLWEKMVDYYQEKYLEEAEMARQATQFSENRDGSWKDGQNPILMTGQATQFSENRDGRASRIAAKIGDRLILWGLWLKGRYPRMEKVYSSQK
ncbi:MAG: hypothetical protein H6633_19900 [Anaerolineales bacterium]|nr:hypothetical protein [Anaerolineales bacterium]